MKRGTLNMRVVPNWSPTNQRRGEQIILFTMMIGYFYIYNSWHNNQCCESEKVKVTSESESKKVKIRKYYFLRHVRVRKWKWECESERMKICRLRTGRGSRRCRQLWKATLLTPRPPPYSTTSHWSGPKDQGFPLASAFKTFGVVKSKFSECCWCQCFWQSSAPNFFSL